MLVLARPTRPSCVWTGKHKQRGIANQLQSLLATTGSLKEKHATNLLILLEEKHAINLVILTQVKSQKGLNA